MFTFYNVVKTLHILAAIGTIGWLIVDAMVLPRALRTGQAQVVHFAESVASKLGPASALVLILGLVLVGKGHWGWKTHWVDGAIVLFVIAMVNGAVFISGAARKGGAKLDAGQPATDEARRIAMLAGVNGVLLTLIVWLMVAKPS